MFKIRVSPWGWICVCIQLALIVFLRANDVTISVRLTDAIEYPFVFAWLLSFWCTVLLGIFACLYDRDWIAFFVQATVLSVVCHPLIAPIPYYSANDYQFLVSKTANEVDAILDRRGRTSGIHPFEGKSREVDIYRGMRVYFDDDHVVIAVVPSD